MSFKYIAGNNTTLTAADADTLTSIDLGGIFKGQTKKSSFQIGNTGSGTTNFQCQVSGVESDVRANVNYSLDGETWATTATISGVEPNAISQVVQVRYTPDSDDVTTSGTFLIYVVEV